MPWNDASETVATTNGQVYVAAVGTALPATATASLNAAFKGLGLLSEDGISINSAPEFQEFGALQSRQPIRKVLTGLAVSASFTLEQWNEDTVPFAFGGGAITSVSGGYKYSPPDGDDPIDERAMVIDISDGSENHRWVFARCNVSDAVEASYQRDALAMLPVSVQVLAPDSDPNAAPFAYYTDSDAFVSGS